ncbi:MAG TPA: hypothetical protein VGO61_21265 [Steroidobacteraceae bacterium]|jgi:hypothetical protein|nr:hypothetical protein [Steroidobacteraceae bacterium]
MRRAPLSLGDRLEAFGKLRPADAAAFAVMAEILRPREPQGELKSAARRAAALPSQMTPSVVNDNLLATRPDATSLRPTENANAPASAPLPPAGTTKVTALERRPFAPPPTTNAPQLGSYSGTTRSREPPPVIAPNQARAILATLASRPHEGLAIDVAALLSRILRGAPIESLPRREIWSARRGVQLLIDCSPAMTPIASDLDAIEGRLMSILGKERVERLYFSGCPGRGAGPSDRSTWKAWKPPSAGTPVIALTDLGCAGSACNDEWAGADEWGRFADVARAEGSAIVAFLPFPVYRVPFSLARCITTIPWSEALSAARVRRILNDARGGHVRA